MLYFWTTLHGFCERDFELWSWEGLHTLANLLRLVCAGVRFFKITRSMLGASESPKETVLIVLVWALMALVLPGFGCFVGLIFCRNLSGRNS